MAHYQEWSRELLLEKWMADPVDCCESIGLQTPLSALRFRNNLANGNNVNMHASTHEYLEVYHDLGLVRDLF